MKMLTLLKQKVYALEKSERCSQSMAKKIRRHLKGLEHSLTIKDSKQTRIHVEFILEVIAEFIDA